jgi:hypothetical protein
VYCQFFKCTIVILKGKSKCFTRITKVKISEINEKIDNFLKQRGLHSLYLKNIDRFLSPKKLLYYNDKIFEALKKSTRVQRRKNGHLIICTNQFFSRNKIIDAHFTCTLSLLLTRDIVKMLPSIVSIIYGTYSIKEKGNEH